MEKNVKKMRNSIKLTISMLAIVCVSVFSVLADLITPDINERVLTAGYWIECGTINIAVITVLFIVKSLKEDSEKRYNKKYLVLSGTLDGAFKAINKNGAAENFKRYLTEDNQNAKRAAYEEKLQRKKGKIVEKIQAAEAKFNNRRLVKGLQLIAEPRTKKLIRLRAKRDFIDERIKKIDEEISFVKVKYIRITYNGIFGDREGSAVNDRDTSPHKTAFNMCVLFKRAILIVVFSLIFLLSVKRLEVEISVVFFFKISLRLFQVAFGVYSGIDAGSEYIRVNLCDALKQRIFILQVYFDRLKGVAKTVTPREVDLEAIEKEVEREVSEELALPGKSKGKPAE